MKYALSILFVLTFFSCKDKQASDNDEASIPVLDDGVSQGPHIIYRVRVDNLRMRKESDKKSEVLDKLSEGSVVRSRGVESKLKEKVTLRGITYNEPYCQIIKDDGTKGWAYKGGLSEVYVSEQEDPFTGELENLILAFDKIKAPAGIARGQEIMRLVFSQKSDTPEWNDVLFKLAYDELQLLERDTSMWNTLEEVQWSDEDYKAIFNRSYNMNSNDVSRRFQSAGMMLDAGEGMVYQLMDIDKLASTIGGSFTEPMLAFITFESESQKQKLITDAAFIGQPEDLVGSVAKRENFLERHPLFVMNRELKNQLVLLHSILLEGTANTPVYDYSTGQINHAWVKIWKTYLERLPQGQIADKVKAKLQQLEGR